MHEPKIVESARAGESAGRVHLKLNPLTGQAPADPAGRSRTEWISIAIIVTVSTAFALMIAITLIYALIARDSGWLDSYDPLRPISVTIPGTT